AWIFQVPSPIFGISHYYLRVGRDWKGFGVNTTGYSVGRVIGAQDTCTAGIIRCGDGNDIFIDINLRCRGDDIITGLWIKERGLDPLDFAILRVERENRWGERIRRIVSQLRLAPLHHRKPMEEEGGELAGATVKAQGDVHAVGSLG